MANGSVGSPFFIPKSQRFIQSYAPDTSNLVGINYWYNTSEERWYGLTADKTWDYMSGAMDIFGEVSATDGLLYDFKGYPLNHINTYQRTELAGMCMPSNKYIDLTLGATGATYTAPANGWFTINKHSTPGKLVAFENVSSGKVTWIAQISVETDCRVSCPARTGDIVRFWHNADGKLNFFRFIYAEGDQ